MLGQHDVSILSALRARWEAICLTAIVLLAAWLRLRHLGLAEFKSDEAISLRIAHDILGGGIRTVGLTSSSGAANPPLYVYIVAAVIAIHDSVVFATASVAVLSVIAVALTFAMTRPRFGSTVAVVASSLFGTAPWAVLYGRHLWQQDYLPVVVVALLWSLFLVLERVRTRWAALVPLLFLIAIQLNLSSVALILPIGALFAYRARDVAWRAVALGSTAGVVLLAPWLAHNAKHGFRDFRLIAENGRGTHGGARGTGTLEAIQQTVHLASAEGWRFVAGPGHEGGAAVAVGRAAGAAVVVLLAVGILTSLVHVVREGRRPSIDTARRSLLLVWIAGIWLAYITSTRSGVGPHYLIVSYPVSFLFAALGLADAAALLRGRAAIVASLSVAAAVVASFVAFTLSFQAFVQRHGGTAGDYGVIYDNTAALAAAAGAHGLHVDNAAAEYLISGHLGAPPGTTVVATRNRLVDSTVLACRGSRRSFGPLEACFPR